MARGLVRAKAEAYKNLKLDDEFFLSMLQQGKNEEIPEEFQDFDIYLMEKNVMPLLLQGLDALSRHVDTVIAPGSAREKKQRFNPLVWLAQYLLRNHPKHVKDHRSPMYDQFSELAFIEKGRRCLLRRDAQIEETWHEMVKENDGENLRMKDIPNLFARLDKKWFLQGTLTEKLPREEYRTLLTPVPGTVDEVSYSDFWRWFEEYVNQNDVIRASAFVDAARRQYEIEAKAKQEEEDAERRDKAVREAMDKRNELLNQFETITSDMYVDECIARIMSKGATIDGVEEKEGGTPLRGEHIELIHLMLNIWGHPVEADSDEDVWTNSSVAAWQKWLQACDLDKKRPVDSSTLRRLMDKDEFEEYLQIAFPAGEYGNDDYLNQLVEIRGFLEDDVDIIVEAVDDETGEVLQLALRDHDADDVRQRLAASQPILARADRVSSRITELLPST